jgi:N-acetylmuramoyl-L-alanine amidase
MKKFIITICILTSINCIAQNNTNNFVYYGRTTVKLPALSYGMGEDRLGGAKMGYIDSNVLLKIVYVVKESGQFSCIESISK